MCAHFHLRCHFWVMNYLRICHGWQMLWNLFFSVSSKWKQNTEGHLKWWEDKGKNIQAAWMVLPKMSNFNSVHRISLLTTTSEAYRAVTFGEKTMIMNERSQRLMNWNNLWNSLVKTWYPNIISWSSTYFHNWGNLYLKFMLVIVAKVYIVDASVYIFLICTL